MKFLLAFMPKEYKDMIVLCQRIFNQLDTSSERKEAIAFGVEMIQDGKVELTEWSKFGKKLGILTAPKRKD